MFHGDSRSVALVLKAHKEAVNSLCGNGQAKTGTVAAAVASANSTAKEASKEIAASLQNSMKALLHLGSSPGIQVPDSGADDLSVLKVIMKVFPCTKPSMHGSCSGLV